MAAKTILFSDEARHMIAGGIDTLANAVKVTLGPRGRNVALESAWGSPIVTKDGVTVAKEIELEDRFANMGAAMVKHVASKTSDVVGDGTTTATVLAQAIYVEGAKVVSAGADPMQVKRGIEAAVEAVVAELKRNSRPTRGAGDIAQVGTISSNGDHTIGTMIAEAMDKVGNDGVITVEGAESMETTLEFSQGMRFDRGYLSPYFVTEPERMEVVLDDAYVLIHDRKISRMNELLPMLEAIAESGKPLLIVAPDIDGEALATLVVNKLRGALQVCAVKAPGFGDEQKETLQDIAVLAGCQMVSEDLGLKLEKVTLEHLGRVATATIDKDGTTLVEGAGTPPAIEARARQIRSRIEESTSEYAADKLRARLAKLTGGVAVFKVGAATETEAKEKKARVEDAVHATRAAVEEGIVAGGGVALLRALPVIDGLVFEADERYGANIVRKALETPLRQIAYNAGAEAAVVVNNVREGEGPYGYNAATGVYEDLIAAGVIDPTKVVRVALQHAASVASLMLTTEAMVAELSKRAPSTSF